MIGLKTDKKFLDYALEVEGKQVKSKMPAEVALEILQRSTIEVEDEHIKTGRMVFNLEDFEV